MLRSKGPEEKIVEAMKNAYTAEPGVRILVEIKIKVKSLKDSAENLRNILVFGIGPELNGQCHVITDLYVKQAGENKLIRMNERYMGLPEHSRKYFVSSENVDELHVSLEWNMTRVMTLAFVNGERQLERQGNEHKELCDVVEDWFNGMTAMTATPLGEEDVRESESEELLKEGDVIFVMGRNRRLYKMDNGSDELGIVHQGKKISLKEARLMAS